MQEPLIYANIIHELHQLREFFKDFYKKKSTHPIFMSSNPLSFLIHELHQFREFF